MIYNNLVIPSFYFRSSLLSLGRGSNIQIREAESSEHPEIAKIACLAWSEKPDPQVIEQRLRQNNSRAWVAVADGLIVGITTVTLKGTEATSEETVVLPAWRHYGAAQKLLDAMKQTLKNLGVQQVYGESSSRHSKELAYFVRQGFKPYKIVEGPPGFQKDELVYLTRLDLVK